MKLHPRFFDYVLLNYPNVDFKTDVVVSVDNGDFRIEWNLPGQPPTDEDIDATPFSDAPKIDEKAIRENAVDAMIAQLDGKPLKEFQDKQAQLKGR